MTRSRETLIGAVVVAAFVALLAVNALGNRSESSDGYDLRAAFQRTDGLAVGADVRLAGIVVGRVAEQRLDDDFRAHVTLRLLPGTELPRDSAAIIETDGLLGGKYIEIQPGGDMDVLRPGERIEFTQDSVVIEDILARIVAQANARRAAAAQADAEADDEAPGDALGGGLVPLLSDQPAEGN